ncbi:PREDICTED: uncharacterized protein LOC108358359 [Rhagoletis zephyria]|uniref:uncharacterized protein LOC108358359 n=1 Tax=Rhagoletis zephyria TaxID=28612 RepID=UPI000811758E|nr:PREDICTED: uncharacterized protein LOC108358359 [Rhagoletis zephyria]
MSIGMSFICIPSVGRNDQKPIFQLTDQNGRRKWLQLLGVVGPTAKHIFACQRHFSHQMRSSRGLHKWAVPDINLRLYSPAVTASRENEITDRNVSGSLVEDVQGVIEVGVEDFQPSFDSIIEIDSEILDSSADPVIELGVEDFLPIPFSPVAADSASTSNCELFEVEASFEKSLQSHQGEEDTPSSSLGWLLNINSLRRRKARVRKLCPSSWVASCRLLERSNSDVAKIERPAYQDQVWYGR